MARSYPVANASVTQVLVHVVCWLTFAFITGWARGQVDKRFTQETGTPATLEAIVAAMKQGFEQIHSLAADYEVEAVSLEKPELLARYLALVILVKEKRSFAFKEDKRYYHYVRPEYVKRLVPAETEPDYGAISGGREIKAKLDAEKNRAGKSQLREKTASDRMRPEMLRQVPEMEVIFDGKTLRQKHPRSMAAEIRNKPNLLSDEGWFPQDYLKNVGLVLPDVAKPANDRRKERLPDAFALGAFQVLRSRQAIDGTPCVIVECPRREKVWLDPEKGFVVRQREFYDPETGLLRERRHNGAFVEVEPGVWLPRNAYCERCGPPGAPAAYRGRPLVRFQYKVTKVSVNNVPDSLFTRLEIKPGSRVFDRTVLPGKGGKPPPIISYRMPADASQLDQVIQQAIEAENERSSKLRWRQLVLWGTAAVCVLIAASLIWRRYRSVRGEV
jgi:hypothetical protein